MSESGWVICVEDDMYLEDTDSYDSIDDIFYAHFFYEKEEAEEELEMIIKKNLMGHGITKYEIKEVELIIKLVK